MKEYINKSELVAEIERRLEKIANAPSENNRELSAIHGAQQYELINLIQYINTLEVRGINNVWNNANDLQKAEAGRSILWIEDNGRAQLLKSPTAERLFYFRPTNLKMWAYVDELLSITPEVKEVDSEKESLTWEDIRELYILFAEIDAEIEFCKCDIQAETIGYYQEVLKRFKARKGK